MKRLVVLAAVIANFACTSRADSTLDRTDRDAVVAIRRGDFASAQAIAERGLERTRAQANSYAAWTLRLLRAESLVLQQKIADARAALDGAMPASPEFESLRARQKYVEARALIAEGRLRDALDTVEAARGLSANRDVRFDLDVV